MNTALSFKTIFQRGLAMRCPQCGEGRVLKKYISPEESCSACGEDFTRLKADDGPAWLTILIVGHISIPLLLSLEQGGHLEGMWVLPAVIAGTIALSLALLPVTKGIFIAALWLSKRGH